MTGQQQIGIPTLKRIRARNLLSFWNVAQVAIWGLL